MNSRKQFEAWIKPLWHLETFEGNDNSLLYRDEVIQGKWEAWQAASKASEQQLTESRREFTAANATIHNLELKVAQVVAENDRAVKAVTVFSNVTHDITEIICDELGQERVAEIVAAYNDLGNMPQTDAFLAEVLAQAHNEGINYAASRLAAAFNHGFVDKPLTEVCDVVRMILDTKEELANSTLPAADGLSGEYAEKFLEEFAAQLRQGATS